MMMMMSTILEYSTRPTHPCVELGRRKKEKRVVLELPVGTGRLVCLLTSLNFTSLFFSFLFFPFFQTT